MKDQWSRLSHLSVILFISICVLMTFAPCSVSAFQWDILDADFMPRYSNTGKTSLFNYPLADFAARVSAESYRDRDSGGTCGKLVWSSDSDFDCALSKAGFHHTKLLSQSQVEISSVSLALIVKSSNAETIDVEQLRRLARNSLQALVSYKYARINGESRRIIVIAFRGTEFGKDPDFGYDLAIDLAAGKTRYNASDPNNLVHEGFMTSEWVMEHELEQRYEFSDGRTLAQVIENASASNDLFLVTGHSLGGAVATLYAARLIDRGVKRDNLQVYTFGAPSVGNASFRNVFFNEEASPTADQLAKKLNLHRIRNKNDLIPYLAYFEFLAKYATDAVFKFVNFKAKALIAATEFVTRYAFSSWPYVHIGYPMVYADGQDVSSQFNEGSVSFTDRVALSGQVTASFPDHDMGTYLANIRSNNTAQRDTTIPRVTASPASGATYDGRATVTLTASEPGKIYYNLNGVDPDVRDLGNGLVGTMLYTGPIQLTSSTTVRAIAVDEWGNTSEPQKFSYTIRKDPGTTSYLQIQAPATVRATVQQTGPGWAQLKLASTDKIRLYIRNFSNFSDFKTLTGAISVFLMDSKDKSYSVPGALLSDGGIEFSITAGMPTDLHYSIIAVYDDQKHLAPGFPVQQVVELTSSATGGGGTGGGGSPKGTIALPRTGQNSCYNTSGSVIPCAGTGQDGAIQAGVPWPAPRFTDNNDGTVTDNLTGLIWLKNANCTDTVGGIEKASGSLMWEYALTWSNALASGACGLTDGSTAGQWRVPSVNELKSLLNLQQPNPSAWLNSQGFSNVRSNFYWSSSFNVDIMYLSWFVHMRNGYVDSGNITWFFYVWPVRGGQ